MNANNREMDLSLVLKHSSAVERFPPGTKRVLSGMVEETLALTKSQPLGLCPMCGGWVFEEQGKYLCEKSKAKTNPCNFSLLKIVFQQPVNSVQMRKLLQEGKTNFLDKFVSKSGKRYSAYLVLRDGLAVLEFPTQIRIVLVNDDLGILELMGSFISDSFKQATVLTFQDGNTARQEIEREAPDVLITDMVRENDPMDGWAMIPLLAEKKVKYPIIIISACREFAAENDNHVLKVESKSFHELLRQARRVINITTLAIPFDFEELQKRLQTSLHK